MGQPCIVIDHQDGYEEGYFSSLSRLSFENDGEPFVYFYDIPIRCFLRREDRSSTLPMGTFGDALLKASATQGVEIR